MATTYTPCPRCLEYLLTDFVPCALFWVSLIETTCKEMPFVRHEQGCKCPNDCDRIIGNQLAMLESRGYLVTHEDYSNIIMIKILGHDEERGCVCVGRHK